MDQDISSQIARAKELLEDLETSCKSDLQRKEASERTKNLAQEVLLKMRHVLDQSMNRFFQKVIVPKLTPEQSKKARVYFPIARSKEGFESILGRGQMKNLNILAPKVYDFLESIQPYNANSTWLGDFSDFSNEKHIRLTPQEIKKENETVLGGAVHVGRGSKVMMRDVLINGIPVNSEDINQTPLEKFDPRLRVERRTWISFNFENTEINMLWLCKKSVIDLDETIKEFYKLFS